MGKNGLSKGITLIALVITIVVLLILAGVGIATLTGEAGILTKVDEAKEKTVRAREQEQVDLAVAAIKSEDAYTGNHTLNASNLKTELERLTGQDTVEVTGDKKLQVKFIDTQNTYEVNAISNNLLESVSIGDYVNYGKDSGIMVDPYGDLIDPSEGESGRTDTFSLPWQVCYKNKETGIIKITTGTNVGVDNDKLLDTRVATSIRKIAKEDIDYLESIEMITVTEETEDYKKFSTTGYTRFLDTAGSYATNEGGTISYNGPGVLRLTFVDTATKTRPVVTLKAGITYTNGDGNMENPYDIY